MASVRITVRSISSAVVASVLAGSDWTAHCVKEALELQLPDAPVERQRLVPLETRHILAARPEEELPASLFQEAAEGEPPEVQVQLVLVSLPPEGLKELLTSLQGEAQAYPAMEVGREIARRYGECAVPFVAELLGDHETVLCRKMAAHTLGLIGPGASAYSRELAELLKDDEGPVRHAAMGALVRLGLGAAGAVARHLRDPLPATRRNAAAALGQIGPGADHERAHAALVAELLGDADAGVRAAAALALSQLSTEAAAPHVPALEALLQQEAAAQTFAFHSAQAALARLGGAGAAAARPAAPAQTGEPLAC